MLLICAVLDCHVTGKYMWAMLKSIIGTTGDKNLQCEGAQLNPITFVASWTCTIATVEDSKTCAH